MSQILACVCFTNGPFNPFAGISVPFFVCIHLEKSVQNGATNSIYHVWYIYPHLVDVYGKLVGKTTIPWMLWEYLHRFVVSLPTRLSSTTTIVGKPGAHDFPVHMMAGLQARFSWKKRWGHLLEVQPWTLSTGGCRFFSNIF